MPAHTTDDTLIAESHLSGERAGPSPSPEGGGDGGGSVADAVHAAIDVMATTDLDGCDVAQLERLANAAQRVRGFLARFDTRLAARRHQLATAPVGWPGGAGGGPPSGADDGGSHDGPDERDGPGGHGGDGHDPCHEDDAEREGGDVDPTLEFAGPITARPDADRDRDRARAVTLRLFPQFGQALEHGEIDGAHVDALTAALARFDVRSSDEAEARQELIDREETLLGYARVENPRHFRRRCLELSLRLARDHGLRLAERQRKAAELRSWIDRSTGMGHLHATLEPELFEKVTTAIDLQLASMKSELGSAELGHRRLRVDAFAELIRNSGALCPRSAEIIVLCDEATLRTGLLAEGSICETGDGAPLHPEALRRMACDARIIPAVLDGDGHPLDLGRARYEPTAAQRRALATMYQTCAHPECEVPFRRCRIHHVIFWEHLGPTDVCNLLPLCERHHHLVHEGGWRLTMTPDRVITLTSPSGVLTFTGDTRDRRRIRTERSGSGGRQHDVDDDARADDDGSDAGGATRTDLRSAEYESDLVDPTLPDRIRSSTRHGPDAPRQGCDGVDTTGVARPSADPRGSAGGGGGSNRAGVVMDRPAPVAERRRRRMTRASSGDPTLFLDDRQVSAP